MNLMYIIFLFVHNVYSVDEIKFYPHFGLLKNSKSSLLIETNGNIGKEFHLDYFSPVIDIGKGNCANNLTDHKEYKK